MNRLQSGFYLLRGNAETLQVLIRMLQDFDISVEANPDLYIQEYASFGIDDAIDVRNRANSRGLADRRVFIIRATHITREAQNALLKTLEEPPAGAVFFFIVPAPEMLLSTLRSRASAFAYPHVEHARRGMREGEYAIDPHTFASASPSERLELLKPLFEKNQDDTSKSSGPSKRDMEAILTFLSSLECTLGERLDRETTAGLRAVYSARAFIADRGALVKPLLEQLAFLLPVM